MKCVRVGGRKRKICSGDLNREIALHNRAITAPEDIEYSEEFSPLARIPAMIITRRGVTTFDKTGTERVVHADIYIRYLTGVTDETWLEFERELYDILNYEDLDLDHKWLLLRCARRGPRTHQANWA